jgi:uncharacterized membrane protein YdjX (TVP38/TMEM64 family)
MRGPATIQKYVRKFARPVLVLLAAGVLTYFVIREGTNELVSILQKYDKLALVISLVLYTVLGATPVPSEPLTVFLTALYGPLWATLACTLGNTGAALMEFFIGANIGELASFEKLRTRLPFHLGDLPVSSPVFLLLVRMIPGYGSKFVSLAAGIYQVPLFTYTWTAILSSLIGALWVAYGSFVIIYLFK